MQHLILSTILIIFCNFFNHLLYFAVRTQRSFVSKSISHTQQKITIDTKLVGMETTVIEKMGWFNCSGWSAERDKSNYALEMVSDTRENCSMGNAKILLTLLLYKTSSGKPVKKILDEVKIIQPRAFGDYGFAYCKEKGARYSDTHLVMYDHKRKFSRIEKMWKIDYKSEKLVPLTNIKSMQCAQEGPEGP